MKSGDPAGVYVETKCCTECGVPWVLAPDVFTQGRASCLVARQPQGATELRRVLRVFRTQDLDCIRYGGSEPRVVAILGRVGNLSQCDRGRDPVLQPEAGPAARHAPQALGLIVKMAAYASGLSVLSAVAFPPALSARHAAQAAIGALSLVCCWGALRGKAWGYWSLLTLLLADVVLGLLARAAWGDASLLGSLFFGTLALGLFSHRHWYSGDNESTT